MSDPSTPEERVHIRPATAQDRAEIRILVRSARLFPFGLRWERFLVAELEGRIVGVGQVRPHLDGSRELASLAVAPDVRRRGIGSQLVKALLAREHGPLHLFCRRGLRGYYRRFGFEVVQAEALGWELRLLHQLSQAALHLLARLGGPRWSILAMARAEPEAPQEGGWNDTG